MLGVTAAVAALLVTSALAMRLVSSPIPETPASDSAAERQKRIAAVDRRMAGWEAGCDTSEASVITLRRSDVRYIRALLHGPDAASAPVLSGAE